MGWVGAGGLVLAIAYITSWKNVTIGTQAVTFGTLVGMFLYLTNNQKRMYQYVYKLLCLVHQG